MANNKLCEEIIIRVFPTGEKITVEERSNGVLSTKNITLDDLVDCFQSGVRDTKRFESGFLPEGCISFSLSDSQKTLVLVNSSLRVDYTYFKTVYENFPLPRMVFAFDLNLYGQVTGAYMAVMADEKPKASTQLFKFPFSNVYHDGRICIGAGNELPAYKKLPALAGLPHHILSLPNNDHNYDRGGNRLKLGYRELLDHLWDKEPSYYYDSVLIPWKGKTLQNFMDRKLGRYDD
jgi:hypothetical protein